MNELTLREFAAQKGISEGQLLKYINMPTLTEQLIEFCLNGYHCASDWWLWKLKLVLNAKDRSPVGLEKELMKQTDLITAKEEAWYNGFYSPLLWKLSQAQYSIIVLYEQPWFLDFIRTIPPQDLNQWFNIDIRRILGRVALNKYSILTDEKEACTNGKQEEKCDMGRRDQGLRSAS